MEYKSILILGGSGTFGRAFVSYLLTQSSYERICIYSRGEWKQAQMRNDIPDPEEKLRWFIGDVRDKDRLKRAMQGVDVVVAAAALKRIEVGNYAPDEMIKTNVIGSMNIVEAAQECHIEKVVALSTDKAWAPKSPYGQTKALMESLFLNANNIYGEAGPKYSVCRYGNIFNSTGSIYPLWKKLINSGGTSVPVTDPNCTRFFMRPTEAVELVIDTIKTMKGGELVIPDWLPAYSVGDLATALNMKMDIIGLPKWEKLHECMDEGLCSDNARRMTIQEIRDAIEEVNEKST